MASRDDFREKLNRLIKVKIQEIRDGCLCCQGKVKDSDGCSGCIKHQKLINDIIFHPKKYAKELLKPGD